MTNFIRLRPKSNKAIFLFICLIVFMAASAGLNAQQREETNSSKSCLWVVETPSNRVFLLGSLHLLKSDAYPLAAEIGRAYALSQRLVFETDLEAMMDPAIQAKMMGLGVYPEGQDLFENICFKFAACLMLRLPGHGIPQDLLDLCGRKNAYHDCISLSATDKVTGSIKRG